MARLVWKDLLSAERLRPLLGGPGSVKSEREGRTEFERDYGRTIYSAPFRRLKDKAQVFPLEPSDYIRTRLIHSLEVSTVAEDLAFQVVRTTSDLRELQNSLPDAIPLVAATCGLIHDLGNPPFGHAGELAISTWFAKKLEKESKFLDELTEQQRQDFLKFEGNAHTLRIISDMWLLADEYGLDYTCATFSAARKYLPPSHQVRSGHSWSKTGHFWSERDIIAMAEAKTGTQGRRHPLTFLVEAADDIVYSVVDLEDGIKLKVLNWRDLRESLEEMCGKDRVFKEAIALAERQIGAASFSSIAKAEAMAQAFRIAAISQLAIVAKEMFRKRYESIMEGTYDGELLVDDESEARTFVKSCKDYAKKNLYTSPAILKLEISGRHVIHDLMDLLWESIKELSAESLPPRANTYPGKIYELISDNYRRVFEKNLKNDSQNSKYYKLQLVTDYIAGMTDSFACRLHKDLTNE